MSNVAGRFEGFVHVEGGRLVDGTGRPLLMRGVGLGNWLLPEGYMWRFPREAPQSPRQIEALVRDLVGEAEATSFWRTFRDRFVGEGDIERIAAEGFDHVRVPLNARLLIDDDGALLEDGLALLDRLVGWCRRHGLWAILDLHGAPGGQTGTNIDDSPRGEPDLFLVGGRYRDLTVALWTHLAARYRDEPAVAGYDLLNEPLPFAAHDPYAPALAELYRDLTAAIRAVDPNHLLIYEGTRWATDWSIFTEAWDANSMLQFHKYWSAPDRASIARFVEHGARLGLPIYMGEGGENDREWLQAAFGLYEDLGISWNFWPWKKLETWSSPLSVRAPEGWDDVVAYAAGRGPRPDAAAARRILAALLDGLAVDACEARPGVVNALFRRAPLRLAAVAFTSAGVAEGPRGAAAGSPFRAADGVNVVPAGGVADGFDHEDVPDRGERFHVVLEPGDWVEFRVELRAPAVLSVRLDPPVGSDGTATAAVLRADGLRLEADGDGGAVTPGALTPGRHNLRLEARGAGVVVRALEITCTIPDDHAESAASGALAPATGALSSTARGA